MQKVEKTKKHNHLLVLISFITALSQIALGYLAMPFAAGFYAALLFSENGKRRLFSYVLPIFSFVLNFLINGFLSLEGVAYAMLGALIYLLYTFKFKKADAVFFSTLLTLLLASLSLVLLAFDVIGVVRASAISEFYMQIYKDIKDGFMAFSTTLVEEDALGLKKFVFNVFEAEELFLELAILFVPLLMVTSLIIAGIAIKIFDFLVKKANQTGIKAREWTFNVSRITAVFYLFLALISGVATDSGVISLSVQTLYFIFLAVFFYLGLRSVFNFISNKSSKPIGALIAIGAIVLFSTFIFELLSFVGAFIALRAKSKA